jgi:LmbE family N-acetylglucosaminyl deacetylase
MRSLSLAVPEGRPLRLLAIGAHADDIEIGCGGTVLRLAAEVELDTDWVVFSASGSRRQEAEAGVRSVLGESQVRTTFGSFRDGYFPYDGAALKDVFEELKSRCDPDLVLTHCRQDLHQDHRLVSELTWNTFRRHTILEYEVPKYDGDLGTPNVYVPLTEAQAERKIGILMETFATQRDKHWFTPDLFSGLMRIRGMESGAAGAVYAEAFYGRKLVLF